MIIFISGSINAGKSTVAKMIAEHIGNTALIEVDRLSECIGWMTIEETIPVTLENAAAIAKNFARRGLHVVLSYPLLKREYEYLVAYLQEWSAQLFVVTLSPRLEVALSNRGSRELTPWQRARVVYHYAAGIHTPDFGLTVDNSDEAPGQTASRILALLNQEGVLCRAKLSSESKLNERHPMS